MPLALQIMALLVGGLIVAQVVTLLLTLLLPPAPVPKYGLDDIAGALQQEETAAEAGLQRVVQAGPPDVSGPGWLVSERSRQELAQLMRVTSARVSLAFYTPLPFAGTAGPPALAAAEPLPPMADDGFAPPLRPDGAEPAALMRLAHYAPQPGGPGISGRPGDPGGMLGGGTPGLGFPGGFPREGAEHGFPGSMSARPPGHGVPPPGAASQAGNERVRPATSGSPPGTGATSVQPRPVTGLPTLERRPMPRAATPVLPQTAIAPLPLPYAPPAQAPDVAPDRQSRSVLPRERASAPTTRAPSSAARLPVIEAPEITSAPPAAVGGRPPASAVPVETPAGPPITVTPTRRSLFGLAPAPFVEGDFVAALRLADGRWAVVQPAPEPFPNSWQRRVLLWFAIALALVVPLGLLFARYLVRPIKRFASAAEQLGRDPAAAIGPLDGPAEIGRAARAFHLMQNRLRAFVDDRTAMVGAISHDLRTPLTRMRFRIEDVDDGEVRDGLLEEVDAMEAMIAQVIEFIRDASAPAPRERLDLGTLVDDVVEDARMVGGDVRIERADPALVEVDVLGMRRLLDNLLENAVKYGERARVRLRVDGEDAVAEIVDDGPGLPEDELERVFAPFYRSEAARGSNKAGSGLGLAVCRSIARAHGGDVRLGRAPDGFRAEVRLPLAFGGPAAAVFAE